MKRMIIVFLVSSMLAMKEDTKIDIQEFYEKPAEVKCECKLCKGIKIAVATNILSIIATAGATMLINYSQCNKY